MRLDPGALGIGERDRHLDQAPLHLPVVAILDPQPLLRRNRGDALVEQGRQLRPVLADGEDQIERPAEPEKGLEARGLVFLELILGHDRADKTVQLSAENGGERRLRAVHRDGAHVRNGRQGFLLEQVAGLVADPLAGQILDRTDVGGIVAPGVEVFPERHVGLGEIGERAALLVHDRRRKPVDLPGFQLFHHVGPPAGLEGDPGAQHGVEPRHHVTVDAREAAVGFLENQRRPILIDAEDDPGMGRDPSALFRGQLQR